MPTKKKKPEVVEEEAVEEVAADPEFSEPVFGKFEGQYLKSPFPETVELVCRGGGQKQVAVYVVKSVARVEE